MSRKWLLLPLLVVILLVSACSSSQETIKERNRVIGQTDADSEFMEARQIAEIEEWKDNPDKIVNFYIINPVTGGLLIPPVQCKGVPASSTESLEPNEGKPTSGHGDYWKVPTDGVDVLTNEMAGRDGTFGEPVHYRQCMTVDGNYIDISAYGMPYIVSSYAYTFPEATVQRDYETEARLMQAEAVLKNGGCIDVETLVEIPCSEE
ncbi:hypothetical protein A2368_00340 [Candidatus Collierbacteria bacterium RIFOXYB1_FULL_49_13]|uniref:Lipoprotein n=1 Tax=Candidatus Collierbacteria bacterium RIFOXYB1_FULL_49_13 TaxID=1817728 RepID=A0A1F5FB78_9BACT|nr:MAG: hypothetical protein A2368_00340 [Candidatus Collierbacteria bacterium RIFOXYB1_FULL_49_13]